MAATQQDDDDVISGINVTPLVDITLVLLIIFMVTAKLIVSQSLPLDLPKAVGEQDKVQLVLGLELSASGDTFLDGKKLANAEALLPFAREAQGKNPELRAVIKADSAVQHGRVIRVLDLLKQAGVSRIAFGVSPVPPEPGGMVPASGSPAPPPIPIQNK